jgi:N-sulfoglucosamine sulfohydrolase
MDGSIDRREFLKVVALGASGVAIHTSASAERRSAKKAGKDSPNILWITCEDISPALGCYGDAYALTPNLDRMAAEGILYRNAFATAPVCSPARSCLITGMYATSLGTQHLRSDVKLPEDIKCFTEYLRGAGYYCSNNYKQDYNFKAPRAWDDSSKMAHWRHRKPGQPFFSVFNSVTTHQSQIDGPAPRFFAKYSSNLKPEERHDPAQAVLPPFYPDTPTVRDTWARYYDLITLMDREMGYVLEELEQGGLADSTIVFFFSDHGFGMPRFKRTLYDSGLRVPLIVRFPEKYRHLAPGEPGTEIDNLVSFVDFAPTVLSLVGLPIAEHMQGQPFLGPKSDKPRKHVFGASSRVDEAYEVSRCVRDTRYKYIRNYMPHLPYAQVSEWPDAAQIAQELRRLAEEGKLSGTQKLFFESTKPLEELYDVPNDPHEMHNLADSPAHQKTLDRLRQVQREWLTETLDIGFLPEAEMHIRSEGSSPYEVARQPVKYPQQRIVAAADLAGKGRQALPHLVRLLEDSDPAARYWAAVALRALGSEAAPAREALSRALLDASPNVRFEAAGALCKLGQERDALPVLVKGLDDSRPWVILHAARSLQSVGEAARPVMPQIRKAREKGAGGLYEMFIRWALEGALRNCQP